MYINPIIATIVVSLISFVGVLGLAVNQKILNKIVFWLVAISAGSLMGAAMIHLIPEAIVEIGHTNKQTQIEDDHLEEHTEENKHINEENEKTTTHNHTETDGHEKIFLFVLFGFALFFILERMLHWHHCHKNGGECHVHTFTYMNLIGDGFHNFIDGLVIAAAFSLNFELGIATTVGVIIHEIPQEISDFGVLLYGGFTKGKALLFNFLSGTLAIIGAIAGIFLTNNIEGLVPWLIAITAGGFIYVSASDLIPELHKEPKLNKALLSLFFFFVGILIMFLLKDFAHVH